MTVRVIGSIDDIELIVLTHQHMDHIGLVDIIVGHSGADVAAIDKMVHFIEHYGEDAGKVWDGARLLAPLLLAPLLMLTTADTVVGRGDPGRHTAAVAAALTAGALTTVGRRPGSARFTLLYGAVFIALLPMRLWSLSTRAREHWGTRSPQPHSVS